MKFLLMFLILLFPSRQVERMGVEIMTSQDSVFTPFENENFIQNVSRKGNIVYISVSNMNYLDLNLNHRLFINESRLRSSDPSIQGVLNELFNENISLRQFISNISYYLKDKIKYWENSPFKTPREVIIYRKANCIGYSALFKELLGLVNIRSEYVSGFYLKKHRKGSYEPVPHRWLEIFLPQDNTSFFFDPQYQGFKANYLMVLQGRDITTIEKFRINILHREKKIIN